VDSRARAPGLRSETMDGDDQARAKIMEHWRASEEGDSATELVTHETQYFADLFDPPGWRSALAEQMPGRPG
jgi:hypothetical protein